MSSLLKTIINLPNERWFILGFWYSVLSSFGTLHGILFGSYHLDMFISVWQLSSLQIASVHLIYMIWNVTNDLISGYISDWYQYKYPNKTRLDLVKPINCLWCFVTLLPFYSFSDYLPKTVHYFITISLYDGFFSFICITTGAIWTDDLTSNQNERVKLQLIQKPLNAVMVSILSFISYYFWDKRNLYKFRVLLWIVIIFSILSTQVACYKLNGYLAQNKKTKTLTNTSEHEQVQKSLTESTKEGLFSLRLFIKQVSKQYNLWMFIGASVINETQSVFLGQFTSIFTDVLLSEWSSSQRASYLSTMSFINTWIGIGSLYLIQQKYIDLYFLCKYSIMIKVFIGCVGLFMYLGGTQSIYTSAWFCGAYLSVNKLCNSVFVSFFMITVANLCDEQKAFRIKNNLGTLSSMVSMYWGLHALCAKPFNSLGPVTGTYVLEKYGYNQNVDGDDGEMKSFQDYGTFEQLNIKNGCFQLMLWFLLLLSMLQFLFWRKYTLYGKKLFEIQRTLQHEEDVDIDTVHKQ